MVTLEIRLEVLLELSLLLLRRLLHRLREFLLTMSREVALLGLVHSDLLHRGSPTVGVVVTSTAAAVAAVRHPPHADHAPAAATAATSAMEAGAVPAAIGGDRVAELDDGPGRHSRAAQDGVGRRGRRRASSCRRSTATRPRVPSITSSRLSFALIKEYLDGFISNEFECKRKFQKKSPKCLKCGSSGLASSLVGVASDVIDGSSLMVTVVRVCEKDTEHGFGFPLAPVPPLRTPPPPELALPLTEVTMTVAVEADFWTALVWF